MIKEAEFGETSQKYIFFNIVFMVVCIFLNGEFQGGGTGDIEEGESIIIFYIVLKSVIGLVRGVSGVFYKRLRNEKVSYKSYFWIIYSLLIIAAVVVKNYIFGYASGRYENELLFRGTNVSIIILAADCFAFIVYSLILGIVSYFKQEDSAYLSIIFNFGLFIVFLLLVYTRTIGRLI